MGASVSLELVVAPGVTLSQLTYSITNAALLPAPQTGSVDVSNSLGIQFLVGGLPVGDGYTIVLTGGSAGPNPVTCQGTASFSVAAGTANSVTVALACTAPLPTGGSIITTGTLTFCGSVTSLSATPSEANVGATVALAAAGIDSNQDASDVTFAWSLSGSPLGTLSATSGSTTNFTCTAAGVQSVTVTALVHGDPACGPESTLSIPVRCDATCSWGFTRAATAATGSAPTALAIGDWNGDGKLDLAVGNSNQGLVAGTVWILLGRGDGTFVRQAIYPSGGKGLSALVAADFNGDGKLDLAVANSSSNNLGLLLGHGDGTFGATVVYPAGSFPNGLAVADFNGDLYPDLAVASFDPSAVGPFIMLGGPSGVLNAPVPYTADVGGANAVAAGDLNGDGAPDLVVPNDGTDGLSVLLGKGDGSLGTFTSYLTGSLPWAVAIGDVNGDGKRDLAVANQAFGAPSDVSVFLGNGDGTFQGQARFAAGSLPWFVSIADLDGDGKADLVVGDNGSDDVGVLLGNGDGTFRAETTFATGSFPSAVAIGDLNGDGRLDVAVTNQGGTGGVTVLLGSCGP